MRSSGDGERRHEKAQAMHLDGSALSIVTLRGKMGAWGAWEKNEKYDTCEELREGGHLGRETAGTRLRC